MQNTVDHKKRDLILIIDDQPINLKVLAGLLSEDYDISIANSGLNALKMLHKGKPDLILLDVMMPGLDGFEVCEKIKNSPGFCDIPVIFLTGRAEINDMAKGFSCGAVDYIIKPFSSKEVKLRVATHLKLYHAKNQMQILNEELKESRESLRQMNRMLEKNNREKDLLFSILAHDLRNPLSVISGYGQMLQHSIQRSQLNAITKYANYITRSAEKINDLIGQLFQYSQSGKYLLQFEPMHLSLNATVKEILSFYFEMARQKSVHLQLDIPDDLIVQADSYMLNTVLRNLIGNAIKFSYPGGTVKVKAVASEAKTIITVKDHGMGMSPAIVKNLFSINKPEGREGTAGEVSTSLGLRLCKDFVEKHGGEIWAESKENKGSDFYFSLPHHTLHS